MKKLMLLTILGMAMSVASGCRIGECWREAWRSRLCPQQPAVVYTEPCVEVDSCCSTPACAPPCNVAPAISQ